MPRSILTLNDLSMLPGVAMLLALSLTGKLDAQQAAHYDVTFSSTPAVNPTAGLSVTSFSVNNDAGATSLSPTARGSVTARGQTLDSTKTAPLRSRLTQIAVASQASSQAKIDSSSIQSKASVSDLMSSQRSTANQEASYPSHQRAASYLAAPGSALSSRSLPSHRSALLDQLTANSNRLGGGHRAAFNPFNIGAPTAVSTTNSSAGQSSPGQLQGGHSFGTDRVQSLTESRHGSLNSPKLERLRTMRSGLRRNRHASGPTAIR